MRTLGYITAVSAAVGGAAVGLLVVESLPEVRRYVKMRKM